MIFRRQAHGTLTKLHLRMFSLYQTLLPWYSTNIEACQTREFLCPKIRNTDWTISTPRGEDIEKWFRQHGKGHYCIRVSEAEFNLNEMVFVRKATISCTDRNTVLMFKLQMGGR